MTQAIYVLVLQFMTEIPPQSRFSHVRRWQLGNLAYEFIDASTAAWSPVRPAAFRVALQLLLRCGRSDQDRQFQLAARLDRQVRRAIAPSDLQLAPNDTVVELVRRLVRAYRVERAVTRQLLRGRQRAAIEQLHRVVQEVIAEDVSSESESSQ